MNADKSGRAYVEEAHHELTQYAQAILRENERLRAALATLESDKRRLGQDRDQAMVELMRLRAQLGDIEQENQKYAEEYHEIERQSSNLSNLYVASYQLHSSVDRQSVLQTIQEIVINLIGSEEIAIFEGDPCGKFRLVSSVGLDSSHLGAFSIGEGPIGQRLTSGEVFVKDAPGDHDDRLTACVPLKVGESITGAIVVFRLLPHKTALERIDHELFELLAVHAATALYCATLHAKSLPQEAAAS